MSIRNALASVAVNDLNAAVEWYGRVLGKPPDSRPMPEVAEWKFERGGWLQVYQLPDRAGACSFTLAVSHIDEQVADLARLGIDTSQRTSGDKVKTLMITDPDGNHIAFAEAIDPGMAQMTIGRMVRALVLATLSSVVPATAAAQALSVLHIKVVLVDAERKATPVPRHALLISDNPASAAPRRIVTALDGTADVRLRPGNYTVESDRPVAFQGKAYQWTQMVDIAAGRDAVLELTADNAEVELSPPPRPIRGAAWRPTPRCSCLNGRTASSRSGRRPPTRRDSWSTRRG